MSKAHFSTIVLCWDHPYRNNIWWVINECWRNNGLAHNYSICLNTTYNSSIYHSPHFAVDGMGFSFPTGLRVHCFCELGGTGNCSGTGNERWLLIGWQHEEGQTSRGQRLHVAAGQPIRASGNNLHRHSRRRGPKWICVAWIWWKSRERWG